MATRKNRKIKIKSGSKSKNSAVKKIQKAYKKKQTRKKSKAATKIQSRYRKKQTRKKSKAATKLQKMIRGTISRKECSICQMPGARFKTKCNHFFHKKCLKKWCKNKGLNCPCPLCRKKLDEEELNNLSISPSSDVISNSDIESDDGLYELQESLDRIIYWSQHLINILEGITDKTSQEQLNRATEQIRERNLRDDLQEYSDYANNNIDILGNEYYEAHMLDIHTTISNINNPLEITEENYDNHLELLEYINIETQDLLVGIQDVYM
tara:strand:+ start:4164 stop:4964 length:801 start_codon:yes stop_codon:yes gene_type:complete